MSANNQTLIQEYNGKWYVFANLQAESWVHYDEKTKTFDESRTNELHLGSAAAVCDSFQEAYDRAEKLDEDDYMGGTEYGIQVGHLCKDGAPLNIIP